MPDVHLSAAGSFPAAAWRLSVFCCCFMRGNFQGKEKGKETGNKEEKGREGGKVSSDVVIYSFITSLPVFVTQSPSTGPVALTHSLPDLF